MVIQECFQAKGLSGKWYDLYFPINNNAYIKHMEKKPNKMWLPFEIPNLVMFQFTHLKKKKTSAVLMCNLVYVSQIHKVTLYGISRYFKRGVFHLLDDTVSQNVIILVQGTQKAQSI